MKNLKILILIGIPASGKSTWAKEFTKYNDDWIRVNRDDFRSMLKSQQLCENKIESMITSMVNDTIETSLASKLNVIVDNTNLKEKYINDIINKFKYSADIDYRVFDISLNKAVERDTLRPNPVGETVIKKMYQNYKNLLDTFNFQPISKNRYRPTISPNFNSNLPDAVIFDIDGTIAHMKNRGPFDWDQVYKDDLNNIVAEHIEFHKSKGREIIIVTGRDESCKDITIEWLELHNIKFDQIFTRPKDDYRKDTVVKKEIYNNEILNKYNLLCVYDDRLQIIDMWYEQNIFTFNVNQGNHKF